jgi:lambda family phage minor tail protein L
MATPTTDENVKIDQQRLNTGSPVVHLFILDATHLGASQPYYFTPGTDSGSKVTFDSIEYNPVPVEFEGLEQTKDGKMARPLMRISNISALLLAEVITYKGLVGSKVTRKRTFKKYLDGEAEANPDATFVDDVFFVNRKTKQNKFMIEWELRSALDLENIFIPKRQCLAMCTHRYSTTQSWATCPYDGSNGYFTEQGASTTVGNDKCGKTFTDCRLRYPIGENMPFRGYPGIGNFGVPYR